MQVSVLQIFFQASLWFQKTKSRSLCDDRRLRGRTAAVFRGLRAGMRGFAFRNH
jgi:hypothetical protein